MSDSNIPQTDFGSELFSYEYLSQAHVCRFCWTRDGVVEIFSSDSPIPCEDEEQQWVDKIRDCLSIDLDPDMRPLRLCESCACFIDTFYKFKRFCHESDRELRKKFESHTATLPHVLGTAVKIEEITGEDEFGGICLSLAEITDSYNQMQAMDDVYNIENAFDKFQRSLDISQILENSQNTTPKEKQKKKRHRQDVERTQRLLRSRIVGLDRKTPRVTVNRMNLDSLDTESTSTVDKKVKSSTESLNKKTNQKKNTKIVLTKKNQPRKPYHTKNILPEFCIPCGMLFETIIQLSVHNLEVHGLKDDGKTYYCFGCNREFTQKGRRVRHELIFCKKLKDGYKCPRCDRLLPYRKVLQWHMKEHTNPEDAVKLPENIFKCKKCQKCFKTREKLLMHKNFGDPKHPKKDYVCETCGRVFSRPDYLKQHRVIHTGEKRHQCPHCKYSAVQRTSLVTHLRTHTGERPYPCDLCPQRCVSKSNLIAHRRRHLRANKHQCSMCPKIFGYKKSLEEHIANCHDQPVSYVCQFCRATYGRKSCLDRHLRIKHRNKKTVQEDRKDTFDERRLPIVDQKRFNNAVMEQ